MLLSGSPPTMVSAWSLAPEPRSISIEKGRHRALYRERVKEEGAGKNS